MRIFLFFNINFNIIFIIIELNKLTLTYENNIIKISVKRSFGMKEKLQEIHGKALNDIESINHFECIDKVIDSANYPLTERFIKELHRLLKFNTASARLPYFNIGEYKSRPNTIGGEETTPPMLVGKEINKLLKEYLKKDKHTLNEIIDFHVKFEKNHPFQDGNGRVGRLIILKECLKNNVVPFIIFDDVKLFYYRGLKKWNNDDRYLIDTCLHCQDRIKETLDYFKINYK